MKKNKVLLEGSVEQVSTKVSKSGNEWTELILCVENESKPESPDYIPIKCFGKLSEIAKDSENKYVSVQSHIQIYNWNSPDGSSKSFVNVVGEKIENMIESGYSEN